MLLNYSKLTNISVFSLLNTFAYSSKYSKDLYFTIMFFSMMQLYKTLCCKKHMMQLHNNITFEIFVYTNIIIIKKLVLSTSSLLEDKNMLYNSLCCISGMRPSCAICKIRTQEELGDNRFRWHANTCLQLQYIGKGACLWSSLRLREVHCYTSHSTLHFN